MFSVIVTMSTTPDITNMTTATGEQVAVELLTEVLVTADSAKGKTITKMYDITCLH